MTIVPYFKVHDGKLDEFRNGCGQFIEVTKSEPGCLYYGFTFNGDEAHCREGYTDADALLAHLDNVGAMLRTNYICVVDVDSGQIAITFAE